MAYEHRLRSLLCRGYFPKELPPTFSTESFGQKAAEILSEWQLGKVFSRTKRKKVAGKYMRGSYSYQLKAADAEIISAPKRGYERRNLHITHPVPQALLCHEMAQNWLSIQKWLTRQTFSLDQIRISQEYERGIKSINFNVHQAKKGFIEATSNWIVRTDISRFYPTIYTHSIPWAAYGKEAVKQNRSIYDESLADRMDLLVRKCNRDQTVGIPIGPETSRILAEIISARLDVDFQFKMVGDDVKKNSVDRLQDDWFVGATTLEQAESILSKISAVYRSYGLEINGSKTAIERMIAVTGSQWVSELGSFLSHAKGDLRGSRLRELLSLCLRMQAAHPTEPVTPYVLPILEGLSFQAADVEALESFLLKSAVNAPIALPNIARILINVQHSTGNISVGRVRDRFTDLAEAAVEKGNILEVIWLIYTLRGLGARLHSDKLRSASETCQCSALALLLMDMASKGQCIGKLPVDVWADQITEERIATDWIWLLAYEGIRLGWLPDRKAVMSKPFFKAMASRGVEFYNPRRNIEQSEKIVRIRSRVRRRQRREASSLLQLLRGFHPPGY
jgi:hypothetical protein